MRPASEVRVMALPGMAAGFRLSGLPVIEASSPEEAAIAFDAIAAEGRTAIVIAQEEIAAQLPDRGARPLVVRLPHMRWQTSEETAVEYVASLLRSAIGYHVRVR